MRTHIFLATGLLCTFAATMPAMAQELAAPKGAELAPDEEPSESDAETVPPTPGWSREAAIAGFVAAPLSAILGTTAYGTHGMNQHNLSIGLRISDLSIVGIMGPVVAAGAMSARRHDPESGSPFLRLPAHALYAAGTIGLLVNSLRYKENPDGNSWQVLLFGGAGATALLLHAIDATISYRNAVDSYPQETPQNNGRPWMWTSLAVGVAAGVGAIGTGLQAQKKFDAIDDVPFGETLCEDMIIDGQSTPCAIHQREMEAKRWAGATDMLIGLSASGIVMGAVLYFMEPKLRCPRYISGLSLSPVATADFAGVTMGGRF